MFASKFAVMQRVSKAKGTRQEREKRELDWMKVQRLDTIYDKDIWENNRYKLRFRKFPWGHWFMGTMWVLGTLWIIYELWHTLSRRSMWENKRDLVLLLICLVLGILFLYKGKVKSTIFDKTAGTLTIKKRNTCCDKRSITTYRLEDIDDIRAVHRGYKTGGVDTQKFSILVLFKKKAA